ncbi:MAG: acetyl-CoA carboxylase biotin carboxyl carrier protein [Planctomycetota bacterium]|jgi:acetyl-CoA carboxylase biotin carboxyl carrier protein
MDVKDLKKIVQIMNDNDLVEVEIEEEGKRLRLRKPDVAAPPVVTAVAGVPAAAAAPAPAAAGAAPAAAPASAAPADDTAGMHTITAPMVGTFYSAPSPDADSYVQVGTKIGPESIVCILEAMKVMNEIKAECSGEIVKICVQNAEAVEYGQALYVVKAG